jgi:hypothetical protein
MIGSVWVWFCIVVLHVSYNVYMYQHFTLATEN